MQQIPWFWLVLWWSAGGAGVAPPVTVTVVLTAEDGNAVAGETVVAVDEARDLIVAVARSDRAGRADLFLSERPTHFMVMSPRYQVESSVARGPRKQLLRLRLLPAPSGHGPVKAPVVRTRPPILIRGRVVDEQGLALALVRVDAVRATEWITTGTTAHAKGMVIASVLSDAGGAFTLPIPSGDTQIQPRAAGLVLVRSTVMTENGRARADRPVLVMGVVGDRDSEATDPAAK